MDIEKHFELAEALSEHLREEINIYVETNGLHMADIFYILNKLLVNTLHSGNVDVESSAKVLDMIRDKTLEELEFRHKYEQI